MCRFEFYGWLNLGHFPLLFYRCLFVNKIKRTLHGGLKIYEFVTWNHILKRWFITGGRCGCTWTWCMLIYGLVDVDTLNFHDSSYAKLNSGRWDSYLDFQTWSTLSSRNWLELSTFIWHFSVLGFMILVFLMILMFCYVDF